MAESSWLGLRHVQGAGLRQLRQEMSDRYQTGKDGML